MNTLTPLAAASPAYLEELLARYRRDPSSVPPDWRAYLTGFLDGAGELPSLPPRAPEDGRLAEERGLRVREAFRRFGHRAARLDPLGLAVADFPTEIETAAALDGEASERWRILYCATTGYEFDHVERAEERDWLYAAVEGGAPAPDGATVRARARRLIEAEAFEAFMMKRFPATKRFSGEGVDSQIVLIDALFSRAVQAGVEKAVVAPVHRGRLQLMHNVFGKPLAALFAEVSGASAFPDGLRVSGDSCYHLGITTEIAVGGRPLKIEMISNPSHLEAIDPVVAGLSRATQDGREAASVLPLMFHTDAALSGQGVVAELLQMSGLPGYSVGGTVHVVVNNQIGFTTDVGDARTSRYCTDVAKSIGAPVIHVNADDPDAAARAARLAIDYRQRFGRDIFVDLIGYRRLGHNELDEPRFTQPRLYAAIEAHESVCAQYCANAVGTGAISRGELDDIRAAYVRRLEEGYAAADGYRANEADQFGGQWAGLRAVRENEMLDVEQTGVPEARLRALGETICRLPGEFDPGEKIERFLDARRASITSGEGIGWSTAEALAWASLLSEGISVRLTGEDSVRGTFTQRHGRLLDRHDGRPHDPFAAVAADGARFDLYNSPLTEYAVLGFELGYSWGAPQTLVQWEAQFGDFANGAQIVIDQFLSAGEDKWLRGSGLVLLLPHGLEGGGPEHSSARLERFLALAARGNLQVVQCTSPANHFHALRRQIRCDYRKPLVAMTPKSLLRHRAAVSSLAEMGSGTGFRPVLPDPDPPSIARRVILCSGKIYYDLSAARQEANRREVSLIRLEQLYPFPAATVADLLAPHKAAQVYWCQEEAENMGAWRFVEPRLSRILARIGHRQGRPGYVGRGANPSPAPGLAEDYKRQQAQIVERALAI